MSAYRVRRRGKGWGVQEKRGWFWWWVGPFGWSGAKWPDSDGALRFANLCERVDARAALRGAS